MPSTMSMLHAFLMTVEPRAPTQCWRYCYSYQQSPKVLLQNSEIGGISTTGCESLHYARGGGLRGSTLCMRWLYNERESSNIPGG